MSFKIKFLSRVNDFCATRAIILEQKLRTQMIINYYIDKPKFVIEAN
jgi:hypothetical protein